MDYKHRIKAVGQVADCYATDLSLAAANALDTLAFCSLVYRIWQTDFGDSDLRGYFEAI